MASDRRTDPQPGDPEAHWGSHDPLSQPSRDAVIGLGRLIAEAQTRLGRDATPEAITADLKARGLNPDPAEVARCCADPYKAPGEI